MKRFMEIGSDVFEKSGRHTHTDLMWQLYVYRLCDMYGQTWHWTSYHSHIIAAFIVCLFLGRT